MNPTESFKINLNQNLWGLVVGLVGLGAAEYLKLTTLFWFALVLSLVTLISVGITTFAYTVRYCKNKQT